MNYYHIDKMGACRSTFGLLPTQAQEKGRNICHVVFLSSPQSHIMAYEHAIVNHGQSHLCHIFLQVITSVEFRGKTYQTSRLAGQLADCWALPLSMACPQLPILSGFVTYSFTFTIPTSLLHFARLKADMRVW
jgi:hypothetical protein